MSRERRRKQVSLKVFNNEPTARMAEQRLRLDGIPCLVRSLRGGAGLWGTAFNLPHDLIVYEGDEIRAREVLDIGSEQVLERGAQESQTVIPQWMVTVTILVLVAFLALAAVVVNRAVR
jgi:hypothetical protein